MRESLGGLDKARARLQNSAFAQFAGLEMPAILSLRI